MVNKNLVYVWGINHWRNISSYRSRIDLKNHIYQLIKLNACELTLRLSRIYSFLCDHDHTNTVKQSGQNEEVQGEGDEDEISSLVEA
ncbi:hypothetical protein AIQ71_10400 [Salmonella enterica]|uniref:Uncharacterized protein n=3 Tax=Salmonella enterica TaxID=28901 RepID=A0A5Y7W8J0_SALER|nr:hypothetical protein [Salmonella enterica]EAT8922927.1 hypothetical protein [Salmonella enterica subsp. arizonae serovar 63:z4,z32:-]EAW2114157.1 hypothetical protein [Salmonella enterica subsp. enterica]EBH8075336.1 hypothetical protein [Salmonella bongori]ECC1651310.1 hypothetical protein [Salmonella enterica subsp. arizonae]EDW2496103.1 hypothetical protein [Salmonella enterica subsp. enterica serovar Oranienburg]EDW8123128.1 hypothetical protein [Salmonella enterica subsp. salamae]EDY